MGRSEKSANQGRLGFLLPFSLKWPPGLRTHLIHGGTSKVQLCQVAAILIGLVCAAAEEHNGRGLVGQGAQVYFDVVSVLHGKAAMG